MAGLVDMIEEGGRAGLSFPTRFLHMQVANKYRRDDSKGGNRTNPVEGLSMYRLGGEGTDSLPRSGKLSPVGSRGTRGS